MTGDLMMTMVVVVKVVIDWRTNRSCNRIVQDNEYKDTYVCNVC